MRGAAIVASAVLLAVAGTGYALLRSDAMSRWLTARIGAALGPHVTFAKARVSIWPVPTVVLRDVRLLDPGGAPGPTAQTVRGALDLTALLQRRVVIARIVIDRPTLSLERGTGGTVNAGPALPAVLADFAGVPGAPAAGGWNLPRVRLRAGAIDLVDRTAPDSPVTIYVRDVNATLDSLRAGAAADFTLSARLAEGGRVSATGRLGPAVPGDPLTALPFDAHADGTGLPVALALRYLTGVSNATASLAAFDLNAAVSRTPGSGVQGDVEAHLASGSVAGDGWQLGAPFRLAARILQRDGALAFEAGHAELSSLTYRGLTADTLRARFAYAGGHVELTEAEYRAYGGTWRQQGQLTLGSPVAFDGTVEADGVRGDLLLAALTPLGLDLGIDRVAGTLAFSASGRLAAGVRARLSVRLDAGALDWGGVHVEGPGQFTADLAVEDGRAALRAAQARAARVTAGPLAGDTAEADFTYADRTLHFAPLRFQSSGGSWRYDGSVRVDRQPVLDGRLHVTGVAAGRLLGGLAAPDGSALASLHTADGVLDLDTTLSGTWGDTWGADGALELTAGSVDRGPLRVTAPARLRTRLDVAGGRVSLTAAQAQAAAVALGSFRASGARASFAYADARLRLADLRFTACGGTWTQSGWIAFGSPPTYAGEVRVAHVVPEQLLAAIADQPVDVDFESFEGESEFRGRWTGPRTWTQAIDASGSLLLRGGTTTSSSVIAALWRALFGSNRLLKEIEQPVRIDHLSQSFVLRQGRLATEDLSLVTSDYLLTGLGTIGLDGSVDLQSRITLTSAGVQRLIAMAAIPIPTGGLLSLPPIPARITGTLSRPTIVPEVSHVPVATLQWLVGAVRDTADTIGGTLGEGLESIRDRARKALGAGRDAPPTPAP